MNNIQRFNRDLSRCGVIEGEKILVACSGGADSMLLSHALLSSGYNIEIAHVNFQLRGEESDGDEALVKAWCEKNSIPFHSKSLNAKNEAASSGAGIQDAARKLRYSYFNDLIDEVDANYIAVAHHENDQAETLILHLLRSVNTSALGCMSHRSGQIIRPLLEWSKDDILDWLSSDGVDYRDDSSNTDPKYTRNRIRHEVLPLLDDIRKGTTSHLADWTNRLRTQASAVESAISEASRYIIEYNDLDISSNTISRIKLEPLGGSIWGDMIFDRLLAERTWPLGSREEALILKRASVGAVVSYKNDELRRERDHISLSILSSTKSETVELSTEKVENPQGMSIPTAPEILWVGESSLKGPTVWREWEAGDKIQPSGMEGSVKISDLLTQWKVPNSTRSSAYVLLDADGDVIWVYIAFDGQSLSRISRKVSVQLGEAITVFKATTP